ncbi:MAG: dTDP-4-dehydrorhamnose 3,5-epimerase, partial [Mycoplasmatales bacterium]
IYDVAVDLRPDSKTFGKWYGIELTSENKKMMYIPPMFAHGFIVMSETAIFNYKCTQTYDAASDSGIAYDSKEINVEWPQVDGELLISDKDLKHTLTINDIIWGIYE